MADLVNGTSIQTVFLPDGSILITQEGTGDTAVASSDYWQWDDVWAAGATAVNAGDVKSGTLLAGTPLHKIALIRAEN